MPEQQPPTTAKLSQRARLGILLAVLAVLFALGEHFELAQRFDPLALRSYILSMGAMGIALYLLLFISMLLVSVPGMIFMIAAGLIWGDVQGVVIAYLGANLASIFSFELVRRFQGAGFSADAVNNRWMRRMLAGLERRPIKTIMLLRCFFATAPGLNYGFALSSVSSRQHFIGTVLGNVVPVITIVLTSEWLLEALF